MKQIATGGAHTLALLANGQVISWGYDYWGQVGDVQDHPPYGIVPRPVRVSGIDGKGVLSGVASVAAGYQHSLAVLADGRALSWGHRWDDALGDPDRENSVYPGFVRGVHQEAVLKNVEQLAGGWDYSLALLKGGSVLAWGQNGSSQLGIDRLVVGESLWPRPMPGAAARGVSWIEAGNYHAFAVKADGTLIGWGRNDAGQIGVGTVSDATYGIAPPVFVKSPSGAGKLRQVFAASAGGMHSLAIRRP